MSASAEGEGLLREAMKTACDLLAERIQGSPARSAGHNARLVLEAALSLRTPPAPEREGEKRVEDKAALERILGTYCLTMSAAGSAADAIIAAGWTKRQAHDTNP